VGEEIACQFLERKGYKIIQRNFLRPWGEIDIIAEKSGTIRFVEVKSVSGEMSVHVARERESMPEELVDRRKLKKLARTAALYMESKRDEREFQVDVVGVIMDATTHTARCRLFEQAIGD